MTVKYEEINNETSLNYKDSLSKAEKKMAEMENEIKKLREAKFELTENVKAVKDEL